LSDTALKKRSNRKNVQQDALRKYSDILKRKTGTTESSPAIAGLLSVVPE
jgi:hypothetical protein